MIKVGDEVTVVNWGLNYATYSDWFTEKVQNGEIPVDFAVRYAYRGGMYDKYPMRRGDKKPYIVLYTDTNMSLISKHKNNEEVYLIGTDTLELGARRMTVREIEAELGYSIRLVDEDGDPIEF